MQNNLKRQGAHVAITGATIPVPHLWVKLMEQMFAPADDIYVSPIGSGDYTDLLWWNNINN